MNFVEIYLAFLYILAVAFIPISGYATWYAWNRVYSWDPPRPRLMVVLSIISTIAFIGSGYIGTLVLAIRVFNITVPTELQPVTFTVIMSFEAIPLIIMGYIIWRDKSGGG